MENKLVEAVINALTEKKARKILSVEDRAELLRNICFNMGFSEVENYVDFQKDASIYCKFSNGNEGQFLGHNIEKSVSDIKVKDRESLKMGI